MKLKNISLAASLFGLAATASAQSFLVAGWDFSQYPLSSANTIDLATFTGSVNANYSDYNNPTADVSPFFGTMYYDGQFNSTATDFGNFNPAAPVQPVSGSLNSVRTQPGDGLQLSSISNQNLLLTSGQEHWADMQVLLKSDVSIVFRAAGQSALTDWKITYAAKDFGTADGVTISWDYSTDGSAYTASGIVHNITTADSGYTADFGSLLDGASTVYLRANIGNLNSAIGEFTTIDNVGVSAVPEPSTYALIAGIFGLGVILRRRFRKTA